MVVKADDEEASPLPSSEGWLAALLRRLVGAPGPEPEPQQQPAQEQRQAEEGEGEGYDYVEDGAWSGPDGRHEEL